MSEIFPWVSVKVGDYFASYWQCSIKPDYRSAAPKCRPPQAEHKPWKLVTAVDISLCHFHLI